MMVCLSCNAENQDLALLCNHCGKQPFQVVEYEIPRNPALPVPTRDEVILSPAFPTLENGSPLIHHGIELRRGNEMPPPTATLIGKVAYMPAKWGMLLVTQRVANANLSGMDAVKLKTIGVAAKVASEIILPDLLGKVVEGMAGYDDSCVGEKLNREGGRDGVLPLPWGAIVKFATVTIKHVDKGFFSRTERMKEYVGLTVESDEGLVNYWLDLDRSAKWLEILMYRRWFCELTYVAEEILFEQFDPVEVEALRSQWKIRLSNPANEALLRVEMLGALADRMTPEGRKRSIRKEILAKLAHMLPHYRLVPAVAAEIEEMEHNA